MKTFCELFVSWFLLFIVCGDCSSQDFIGNLDLITRTTDSDFNLVAQENSLLSVQAKTSSLSFMLVPVIIDANASSILGFGGGIISGSNIYSARLLSIDVAPTELVQLSAKYQRAKRVGNLTILVGVEGIDTENIGENFIFDADLRYMISDNFSLTARTGIQWNDTEDTDLESDVFLGVGVAGRFGVLNEVLSASLNYAFENDFGEDRVTLGLGISSFFFQASSDDSFVGGYTFRF